MSGSDVTQRQNIIYVQDDVGRESDLKVARSTSSPGSEVFLVARKADIATVAKLPGTPIFRLPDAITGAELSR